jgi:hypothetical protein
MEKVLPKKKIVMENYEAPKKSREQASIKPLTWYRKRF